MKDIALDFMQVKEGRLRLDPPFDVIIENGNIKLARDESVVVQSTLLTLVREKNSNVLIPELGAELCARVGEKLTRVEIERIAREVRKALELVAGVDFGRLSVSEVASGKVYLSQQEGAVCVDLVLKTEDDRTLELTIKL